jgi:protein-S-isoprenylcysteine O-methyltransferase Ste14
LTKYSQVAKRLRLPLGFILAAFYLAFARPTPLTLLVGGIIAFVGLMVRAWAAGHIAKNDRLATTGPYAHTRNPLYFGSFLIAAGFAIAGHWMLLLLVIAFFVLVYAPTIERERQTVSGMFPREYADYSANVPAFMPRPTPWRPVAAQSEGDAFSLARYMRHKEWQAALGYAAAMIWLWLRMTGVF